MIKVGLTGLLALGCSFTALAVATGCGGSDSNGNGGGASSVNSGVDGSKQGSQLTPDEAQKLCKAVGDYTSSKITPDTAKAYGCNLLASFSATSDADCKAKVDECMAQAGQSTSTPDPGTSSSTCQTDPTKLEGCTATVDELEACYQASMDLVVQAFQDMTCEKIRAASGGDAGLAGLGSGSTDTPAACQTVQEKCPQAMQPAEATTN